MYCDVCLELCEEPLCDECYENIVCEMDKQIKGGE
jgi:hypothetical protein